AGKFDTRGGIMRCGLTNATIIHDNELRQTSGREQITEDLARLGASGNACLRSVVSRRPDPNRRSRGFANREPLRRDRVHTDRGSITYFPSDAANRPYHLPARAIILMGNRAP